MSRIPVNVAKPPEPSGKEPPGRWLWFLIALAVLMALTVAGYLGIIC